MSETYNIERKLNFATLEDIMYHRVDVQLSEVAKNNIQKSRQFLDDYLEKMITLFMALILDLEHYILLKFLKIPYLFYKKN